MRPLQASDSTPAETEETAPVAEEPVQEAPPQEAPSPEDPATVAAEPVMAEPAPVVEEAASEPPKPKRRGWWSLGG